MDQKVNVRIQGVERDFSTANDDFEQIDIGEVGCDEFLEALDRFKDIDYDIDTRCVPKLYITCASNERFSMMAEQGAILVTNLDDPNQGHMKLAHVDATELVFGKGAVTGTSEESQDSIEIGEVGLLGNPIFVGATALVFAGALAFAGFTFLGDERLNPEVEFTPITDASSLNGLLEDYAGTYVTGNDAGDYAIVIDKSQRIEIYALYKGPDGDSLLLDKQESRDFEYGFLGGNPVIVMGDIYVVYVRRGPMLEFCGQFYNPFEGTVEEWSDPTLAVKEEGRKPQA